jgi:hypothetical protein
MLRAEIPAVNVRPGQVVAVSAEGLTIRNIDADTAWGTLMGLNRADRRWRLEGEPDFAQAAPIYALPACPECGEPVPRGHWPG